MAVEHLAIPSALIPQVIFGVESELQPEISEKKVKSFILELLWSASGKPWKKNVQ